MGTQETTEPRILAYGVKDTLKVLGIGRTHLWRLEKLGHIRAVDCLGKKLYTAKELERFVKSLSAGQN